MPSDTRFFKDRPIDLLMKNQDWVSWDFVIRLSDRNLTEIVLTPLGQELFLQITLRFDVFLPLMFFLQMVLLFS